MFSLSEWALHEGCNGRTNLVQTGCESRLFCGGGRPLGLKAWAIGSQATKKRSIPQTFAELPQTSRRATATRARTGAEGIRTPDPHNAIVVLYQLSYDPVKVEDCRLPERVCNSRSP
jgi:hypothetical protein